MDEAVLAEEGQEAGGARGSGGGEVPQLEPGKESLSAEEAAGAIKDLQEAVRLLGERDVQLTEGLEGLQQEVGRLLAEVSAGFKQSWNDLRAMVVGVEKKLDGVVEEGEKLANATSRSLTVLEQRLMTEIDGALKQVSRLVQEAADGFNAAVRRVEEGGTGLRRRMVVTIIGSVVVGALVAFLTAAATMDYNLRGIMRTAQRADQRFGELAEKFKAAEQQMDTAVETARAVVARIKTAPATEVAPAPAETKALAPSKTQEQQAPAAAAAPAPAVQPAPAAPAASDDRLKAALERIQRATKKGGE